MIRHAALAVLLLAATTPALRAETDPPQAPQDEMRALRARIDALERENAELRDALGMAAEPLVRSDPANELDRSQPTLRTRPMQLDVTHGSRAVHLLTVGASDDGRFTATIETKFSGGVYAHTSAIRWSLDGVTHESPVVDYDARRITTGPVQRRIRRDHERVTSALERDLLEAIADSASVEAVMGRTRFTMPTAQRMTLRALLTASDAR